MTRWLVMLSLVSIGVAAHAGQSVVTQKTDGPTGGAFVTSKSLLPKTTTPKMAVHPRTESQKTFVLSSIR